MLRLHTSNPDELWQAGLWRRLQQERPVPHLAALLKEFHERAARPDFKPQAVPERVSIFGISALPPAMSVMIARLCPDTASRRGWPNGLENQAGI
jgi:exonuclease V gamma subunit